jgi:hypothetical protein
MSLVVQDPEDTVESKSDIYLVAFNTSGSDSRIGVSMFQAQMRDRWRFSSPCYVPVGTSSWTLHYSTWYKLDRQSVLAQTIRRCPRHGVLLAQFDTYMYCVVGGRTRTKASCLRHQMTVSPNSSQAIGTDIRGMASNASSRAGHS